MINYKEELRDLKFTFNPDEISDYQTLLCLFNDIRNSGQYEDLKEDVFQTFQVIVLIYGLHDELNKYGNNLSLEDVNNIGLYIYLTVKIYESLEKNNFVLDEEINQSLQKVLALLDKQIPTLEELNLSNENLSTVEEPQPMEETQPQPQPNSCPQPSFNPEGGKIINFNVYNEINGDKKVWELNPTYLKEYIKMTGMIPYKCDICGLEEWQNKPLPLILSTYDDKADINLENLRFLCPNCYSIWGKKVS